MNRSEILELIEQNSVDHNYVDSMWLMSGGLRILYDRIRI